MLDNTKQTLEQLYGGEPPADLCDKVTRVEKRRHRAVPGPLGVDVLALLVDESFVQPAIGKVEPTEDVTVSEPPDQPFVDGVMRPDGDVQLPAVLTEDQPVTFGLASSIPDPVPPLAVGDLVLVTVDDIPVERRVRRVNKDGSFIIFSQGAEIKIPADSQVEKL